MRLAQERSEGLASLAAEGRGSATHCSRNGVLTRCPPLAQVLDVLPDLLLGK